MVIVETLDAQVLPKSSERLLGYDLDSPAVGSQSGVYAIPIEGWVLGQEPGDVAALEVVYEGVVIRRTPVNVSRPDIAAVYPKVPKAERSGFETVVSVLPIDSETQQQLLVQAVLKDDSRVTIGVIFVRRSSLRNSFQPKLQPLGITTLGRSGSRWLTQLLGQHPQIVTYKPSQYEPRVASYWIEILLALSDPVSYLQTVGTEVHEDDHYWWIGDNYRAYPFALAADDPGLHEWLGRNSVEDLSGFCQGRIQAFYEQAEIVQGNTKPVYFAEKIYGTGHFFATTIMWELYPRTREIFLIRDPRDVFCSTVAFHEKVGTPVLFEPVDKDLITRMGNHFRDLHINWQRRSDRAYMLRYEELISHPAETFTSVLDYLELDSDPALVQRILQAATEATRAFQHQHQTSADAKASIGRWRHDLNASLQTVCQEAFGDVLKGFGYAE